jgi:hypothetical protein
MRGFRTAILTQSTVADVVLPVAVLLSMAAALVVATSIRFRYDAFQIELG